MTEANLWLGVHSSGAAMAQDVNAKLIFANRIQNFYLGLTVTGQPYFFDNNYTDYSDTDLILSYPEWNRNDKM